jgi:hypothetical protein
MLSRREWLTSGLVAAVLSPVAALYDWLWSSASRKTPEGRKTAKPVEPPDFALADRCEFIPESGQITAAYICGKRVPGGPWPIKAGDTVRLSTMGVTCT